MFCKYCGKELDNNANFCPGCGKKIDVPQAGNYYAGREEKRVTGTNDNLLQNGSSIVNKNIKGGKPVNADSKTKLKKKIIKFSVVAIVLLVIYILIAQEITERPILKEIFEPKNTEAYMAYLTVVDNIEDEISLEGTSIM